MSNLLSDERLVRRAAGGEKRAFGAIFDRYHQPLYRYCLAIVGDSQDAQDALQNTMLKVLRALPGEEREIRLKPWLYRIAHNESVDLLRRRRDTRELDAELAAPGPALGDELSSRERLRQLLSDLDQLPERQRGALVMRELGGLDFKGIAVALDTSPAVARQTLYEARLGLHQMDEGRGMDCATVTQALSDGDGRITRRRDVRAHLRSCPACRHFRDAIEGRARDFAALTPLPAAVAAGLLQGLLGGGAASGGSGVAGAVVAGGTTKTLGSSAALKGAAAILAVAAIGTGAAERGGVIDLGLPGGGGGSKAAPAQRPAGAGPTSEAGARPDSAPSRHVVFPTTQEARAARVARGNVAPGKHGGHRRAVSAGPEATGADRAGAESVPRGGSAPHAHGRGHEKQAAAYSHGKGHEKQHPDAAAQGRQTAVAHKNTNHGTAGRREHSAKASKPSHPAHPSQPSSGKEKAPQESNANSPEAGSVKGGAPPAAAAEETPAQAETGE
jgi:RNA polymerase sigma factor (sigma-70 family)